MWCIRSSNHHVKYKSMSRRLRESNALCSRIHCTKHDFCYRNNLSQFLYVNNSMNCSSSNFSKLATGRRVRKKRSGKDLKEFLKYINGRGSPYFDRVSIEIYPAIVNYDKFDCHIYFLHDFMYHFSAFFLSCVNAVSVIENRGLFVQYVKKYNEI